MATEKLKKHLEKLLFADTEKFWLNLHHHKYNTLVDELANWELIKHKPEAEHQIDWLELQTIAFLRHKIEKLHTGLQALEAGYKNFIERLSKADIDAEKELHILNYAEELGATSEQLKADKSAFSRWFDEGAVIGRYQSQVAEIEQSLKFLISKLGAITKRYLKNNEASLAQTWEKLNLQPFFLKLLEASPNAHVRHGMIRALVNQVALIHECKGDPELDSELIAKLIEQLENPNTPYLATIDILEILIHQRPTFIRSHMWALLDESVNSHPDKAKNNDQLFILSAIPKVLCRQSTLSAQDERLITQCAQHPYPRVRQVLIEQIKHFSDQLANHILQTRFIEENCDAVRFTIIKQLSAERFCDGSVSFKLWSQAITGQDSLSIKRMALEQSARIMLNMQLESDEPKTIFNQFIDHLNSVLLTSEDIAIKRCITRTREQLSSFYQQTLIAEVDAQIDAGINIKLPANTPHEELGRVLSFRAQQQHAFNGKRHGNSWSIDIGYKMGRRFWRIWHEFFHPSTDKRQSFNHVFAKKPNAELHVPSCTVAEISETNVPGEPLYHLSELSTRPHLPLLDYLLSILSQDNLATPVKSYTPDGFLEISKPNSLWQRAKAYWYLSYHFKALDKLRKGNKLEQERFIDRLNKLGFTLTFKAYGSLEGASFPVEPGIKKLFERLTLSAPLLNIWLSFKEYLYSIYQNTLSQLVFFVVGFIGYFWGRHIFISRKIINNRKQIPISIGGWGTRGKSGTERLKAALFSSLALRVITKTTGCEAMMIYSKSSGEQFEIPLFRPFDKASIWEQSDVLAFATSVKADVFLWECMGLTPRYVKILRRWMRDNFATITNAYPDHEDILGPTGVDVAREMSAFIGEKTQVFTSEQTMMPILNEAAIKNDTTLIQVHWGDGFQITPDIRALFPYDEHPDNIALVAKMAQYIGIEKDFVFKETAERIVPDIGVLQHFDAAPIGTIKQSFVNSMSANERLATLENWRRLDLFDLNDLPHIQTIALINNRNDRVSRSKVFAQIVMDDLNFDYVVVVGSNVDGFYAYLENALQARIARIISNQDYADLKRLIKQFNIATNITEWLEKTNVSFPDTPLTSDDLNSNDTLKSALTDKLDNNQRQIDQLMLSFAHFTLMQPLLKQEVQIITAIELKPLTTLFNMRCIMIDNPHITPDELTIEISHLACHNQHQLIVGMQNIKGVGLNYVYAWQKYQKTHQLCQRLLNKHINQTEFRALLMQFAQQDKFSVLEMDYLESALTRIAALSHAQNEFSQAEITHIKEKLSHAHVVINTDTQRVRRSKVVTFVLQVIESFLDAGAAVKRKKTAQQVYIDIADQRITLEKAITVLAQLNRGQKPGWLSLPKEK
jgi:poly-gamma-glutamate synthase PgsB/CapB